MNHQVEGEHSQNQQEHHFEAEHQDEDHVEGKHDETETINLDENDEFHELNDNFSVTGSENEDMYEDAPLEFNPNFPPLEKWTRNHPKEQVIGNPQDGVLTRAQIRAKNEVLNANQELCMFNVFISKIEPKTVKNAMEHTDWVVVMQSELAEFERNKVWRLVSKPSDV